MFNYFKSLVTSSSPSPSSSASSASSAPSASTSAKPDLTVSLQSQLSSLVIPPLKVDEALPLEHIPLSQEEIHAHSKLQQAVSSSKRPPTGFKDFCRSFLCEHVDLEDTRNSVLSLHWLLQHTPLDSHVTHVLKDQIGRLNDMHTELAKLPGDKKTRVQKLKQIAQEFAAEVHAMQPGESRLMTGNFSREAKLEDNPGRLRDHTTLVYEFTKNENGTYTITICSSGVLKDSTIFFKGNKTRLFPLISYNDVPEIDTDFFVGLLTLATTHDKHITEKHILNAFNSLNVPPTTPKESPARVLERFPAPGVPSRSITASFKVWISKLAGSQDAYRKIMFQLKFNAFLELFHTVRSDLDKDSQEGKLTRQTIESSARNLLRRAKKLGYVINNDTTRGTSTRPSPSSSSSLRQEEPDNSLLKSSVATAYDALSRVLEINRGLEAKRLSQTSLSGIEVIDTTKRPTKTKTWVSTELAQNHSGSRGDSPTINLPKVISPNLENGLDEIITEFMLFKGSSIGPGYRKSIEKYVSQLPIPTLSRTQPTPQTPSSSSQVQAETSSPLTEATQCWDQFDSVKRDQIICNLIQLMSTYRSTGYNQAGLSPLSTQHATTLALHAILHYLIVLKDREIVQARGKGPSIENFMANYWGLSINKLDLVYLDANEFKRIQEVHAYFETFNGSARHQYDALYFTGWNNKSIRSISYATKTYYQQLLEAIPELDADVEILAKTTFKHLTEEQIEADYQEEVRVYEEWTARNNKWQARRLYEKEVDEYNNQRNKWLRDPEKNKNPDPIPAPPLEIQRAPNPGPEPRQPKRKVNIPLNEAKIKILAEQRSDIRLKYDLTHLLSLEEIGYYSRELLHDDPTPEGTVKERTEFLRLRFERTSDYTEELRVICPLFTEELNPERFITNTQFSPLSEQNQHTASKNVTKRHSDKRGRPLAEINTLTKGDPSALHTRLLRAVSESEIPPFQLIYEARQHLEALRDPDTQSLFFRLFFRSPITSKNHAKLGAGDTLVDKDDRALYDLCCGFISQGILHFKSQENGLEGGAFFFEFAYYLAKYLKDSGKDLRADALNQVLEIQEWQKSSKLSKEDNATLHYYKLLFYSLSGHHLEENDLIDLYTSWIIYKNDFPTNIPMTEARDRLHTFMDFYTQELAKRVYADVNVAKRLGEGILKKLGLDDSSSSNWNGLTSYAWGVYPELQIKHPIWGITHRINLHDGYVSTPRGTYQGHTQSVKDQLNQNLAFKNRFGEVTDCKSLGNSLYSLNNGEYRVKIEDGNFSVYRQFAPSPLWYKFSRDKDFPGFLDSLRYDHNLWVLPSNTENPHAGVITSRKGKSPKFIINNDNSVYEVGEGGRHVVDVHLNSNYGSALGFIDGNNLLSRVEVRTMSSLENNPLVFIRNAENKLVWSENHQYALSTHMPSGYFWNKERCLYLQPLNSKLPPKLLITINGGSQYVCFNIENGSLKPTSTEAQLTLALDRYYQGRPIEAINLIATLPKNEKLSANSHELLGILSQPNYKSSPSADEKMVLLHAQARLMWDQQLNSNHKIHNFFFATETDESDNHKKTRIRYFRETLQYLLDSFQSINDISIDCRLPLDLELFLIEGIVSSMVTDQEFIENPVSGLSKKGWEDYVLRKLTTRIATLTEATAAANRAHKVDTTIIEPKTKKESGVLFELFTTFQDAYKNAQATTKPGLLEGLISGLRLGLKSFYDTKTYPIESLEAPHYIDNTAFRLYVIRTASTGSPAEIRSLLFWLETWKLDAEISEKQSSNIVGLIKILRQAGKLPPFVDIADKNLPPEKILSYLMNLHSIVKEETQYESIFEKINAFASGTNNKTIDTSDAYPVKSSSEFDLTHPETFEHRGEEHKIEVNIPTNDSRWNQLKGWKKGFLAKKDEKPAQSNVSFTFDDDMLPEGGENYKDALISALEKAQTDYDAGVKINRSVKEYEMTNQDARALRNEALQTLEDAKQQLVSKEQSLIEAMNKEPNDESERLLEAAKLGGRAKKRLTFEDCLKALLSMDKRVYTEMNPALKNERFIQSIGEQTLEVLELKSQIAQLKRIVDLTNNIEGSAGDSVDRDYHLQKLTVELSSTYTFEAFNDETQIVLRAFAGQTGKIPYPQQTRLLEKMMELKDKDTEQFHDIVIQLIMGGGKTSVLATILMFLTAKREGKSALFLIPSQLFDVVKNNLGDSLKEAFGVTLEPIDLERKDMTEYRLAEIDNLLKGSAKGITPLISKSSTLQSLNLEFFSQAILFKESCKVLADFDRENKKIRDRLDAIKQRTTRNNVERMAVERDRNTAHNDLLQLKEAHNQALNNKGSSERKLQSLQSILRHLKYNTDAILDEVDQLILANLEVNFPIGDKIPISREGNELFLDIFKGLLSNDLKIASSSDSEKDISLHDYMNLRDKARVIIPNEDFQSKVVPVLAQHIAGTCKSITPFIQGHRESFVRLVSGVTPDFIEELIDLEPTELTESLLNERDFDWQNHSLASLQNDLAFRKHLKNLYESDNKTAAKTIYLARAAFLKILPVTLSNSTKRGFGLKDRMICPFLGVNTPANTEFGYHWVLACYYYQWAAAYPPTHQDIEDLVKRYTEAAKQNVQTLGIAFKATAEYLHFFQLFGINLDEMDAPGAIDAVIAKVRSNPNLGLELQYDNIAKKVTYYPKRLSSNGSNLLSQLFTRKGMSGDPWNVEGALESMLKRYFPDLGTEGRIFDAFLRKTTQEMRLTVTLDSISDFLKGAFSQIPAAERGLVTGITDAGALFKKFDSNRTIAEEIMRYLSNSPAHKHIKGVLYFQQDPKTGDDVLYVWKRDATTPEKIGGSTAENLLAHGLSLGDYFTYYADRNTTGTDIPQIPNGRTLFTFDVDMITSKATQALMRYRSYLSTNNAYVVVTQTTEALLYKLGRTALDLILHTIIKQTINKSSHMETHFEQMIDNIFFQIANNGILEAVYTYFQEKDSTAQNTLIETIDTFEDTVVKEMIDDPYQQYGLKTRVNTKDSLKRNLNDKAQKMQSKLPEPEILPPLVEAMEKHIDNARSLPLYRDDNPFPLDMQVQQQQQILTEVKVHVETKTEIKSQIQMNRQDQTKERGYIKRTERKMTLRSFRSLLSLFTDPTLDEQLRINKLPITSIKDQLTKQPFHDGNDFIQFEDAFNAPIYGTQAYFNPFDEQISFFSSAHRPAKQILVCKMPDNTFRWLLLSERECHYVRKHIKHLSSQNDPLVTNGVWLVQPDGTTFTEDGNSESFHQLLHSIVESGDAGFQEQMITGLIEINALDGNVPFLHRYPTLADQWLSEQTDLRLEFLRQKSLGDAYKEDMYNSSHLIAMQKDPSARSAESSLNQARLKTEMSLKGSFVPDSIQDTKLLNRTQHIKQLRCDFVKHLGIESSEMPPHDIERLHQLQFGNLQAFHGSFITPKQVERWLPPEQVKILTDKKQICECDKTGKITRYLLSREQLFSRDGGLVEKQAHLIPFINPEFYGDLNKPWQIAHIPVPELHRVAPENVVFISDDQIREIRDPHLLNALLENDLPKDKYRTIHGNLCYLIPKEFQRDITSQQIREIDNPAIVRLLPEMEEDAGVPEGHFSRHIGSAMIPHIDNPQVQFLNTHEQISQVRDDQVPLLDPERQVPKIKKSQVPSLTVTQVPFCPKPLIRHLPPQKISDIPNKRLKYLREKRQIVHINTEDRFVHLTPNQMKWVGNSQYQWIDEKQVQGLDKDQVLEMNKTHPQVLKNLTDHFSKEQIQSFDSQELIDLLSPDQIEEHLKLEQVKFLQSDAQILSCPLPHLGGLKPHQMVVLKASDKIKSLTKKSQIEALCRNYPELVSKLEPKQVVYLPDDLLPLISNAQALEATPSQLYYFKENHPDRWTAMQANITEKQAQSCSTQEHFDMLLPHHITEHAVAGQVRFMTSQDQVRACPPALTSRLDPSTQVPLISVEQVKGLGSKEQFEYLPEGIEYLEAITPEQYGLLPKNKRNRLTPQQVVNFHHAVIDKTLRLALPYFVENMDAVNDPATGEILVSYLKQKHLAHLNTEHSPVIRKLGAEQVKLIQPEQADVIANLVPQQIQHLSNEALARIPAENTAALKAINPDKLHLLSEEQIKGRDLSWWFPQVAYRIVGIARTILMIPKLMVQFIYDLATLAIKAFSYYRNKSDQKYSEVKLTAFRTFYWHPWATLQAPRQVIHPEKYWLWQSRHQHRMQSNLIP